MFGHIEAYAGDPILSMVETFQKDTRPTKVNLGIGLYYDEKGKIPLLHTVQKAEAALYAATVPRSYLPMEGAADYRYAVQCLLFGASHDAVIDRRIATIQAVGGSGALKVGADFLKHCFPDSGVWVSDPTWENHRSLFEGAGIKVSDYPYYDPATGNLRFDEMLEALKALPAKSIVLLHPICHNPTGVDLSREQWLRLIPVLLKGRLIPFLDVAYQGFGDGVEEDALAIRALANAGASFLVANSFSKNFSLYGERCGGLSVVCPDAAQAEKVLGQLKLTVRRNYSSPPVHGARVVVSILLDTALHSEWECEVTAMRQRIKEMRRRLHETLTAQVPGKDFGYFLTQRGMFSYTGLSPGQVDALRNEHAVYLVRSGRMCLAALNTGNIEHVATALAAVSHAE